MMIYGIDVIMVVPGPVATAIWDKGEATDLSAYEGTIYGLIVERFRRYMIEDGRKGLKPECLGETVHVALTARRPKTSYAVIPKRFKNWTLPLLLPKRMLDTLIGRQLGLKRTRQQT
jgi:short-subunit dehydrogenase